MLVTILIRHVAYSFFKIYSQCQLNILRQMVATNKINQNFLCCSLPFLSQSTKANYSSNLSKLVPSLCFSDADLHRGKVDDPSCFVRVGQESHSLVILVW